MTKQSKDKRINTLKERIYAAKKEYHALQVELARAREEIAKLEENEQHRVRQLVEYKQMLASAVSGEKLSYESVANLDKINKALQLDLDKLRQSRVPESRDGVFIERLKRQHVVMLQLAAFTEGIMLAELVDNPSENLGYDMGRDRVRSFIMASESIVLEK